MLAILLAAGALLAGAAPLPAQDEQPVVHALLFWDKSCANCEYVLTEVLPPLERRYGARLQLTRAEVSSIMAFDLLTATARENHIPKERQGVPLLVIGDQVLIGRDEIAAGLGLAIERGLGEGGLELPAYLGLSPEDAAALEAYSEEIWRGKHATDPVANIGALAVLALMGVGLVYAGYAVRKAPGRTVAHLLAEAPKPSGWIGLLAVGGLLVSGYLTYVKLTGSETVCLIGRCSAVQHSPYAEFLGIPVAAFGFVAYAIILGLWLWGVRGQGVLGALAPVAIFALSLVGTIISAYLTYLEPFVIKAVCMWCLGSAVIMTAILVLSVRQVVGPGPGQPQPGRPGEVL